MGRVQEICDGLLSGELTSTEAARTLILRDILIADGIIRSEGFEGFAYSRGLTSLDFVECLVPLGLESIEKVFREFGMVFSNAGVGSDDEECFFDFLDEIDSEVFDALDEAYVESATDLYQAVADLFEEREGNGRESDP